MKKLFGIGLLLLALNSFAACPTDPQRCTYTIEGIGSAPTWMQIHCPNGLTHPFSWGSGEYIICKDDKLEALFPSTCSGLSCSKLTVRQHIFNGLCSCPPADPIYQACSYSDTQPRQTYAGVTWFRWKSKCGYCGSGWCCGTYCNSWILLYNYLSEDNN